MASSIILSSSFLPSQLSNSSRVHFKPYCAPTFQRTSFATKIRASSTAFAETKPTGPVTVEKDVRSSKNILACPVCYEPVTLIGATVLSVTPFMSFLYERGWRQNFVWGGFPGPEKEDYLKPVLGRNILDASCGSGLFSRLFTKSGLFSLVMARDYSENMLQQCYEFIKQEENFPKENLILVRADIARLPFISGSLDAVHAGAAIHCWPSPSVAI